MKVVQKDEAYCTQDNKLKLLTSYGVKGTGKTAVMRAMVGFDGKPGWIQTADPKARAVTSSFNESGDWVSKFRGDYKKLDFDAGTAFGRHILRYNGMCEEDVQRIGSMKTAVFLLRKKLGQTTPGTLVIGVDEFAMLEEEAGEVLGDLVQVQGASIIFPDEYGGPVVFIMSALTESFFSGVQIGSGRPVLTIRLHNLPQAKAFDLLPADIRNAAKKDGRIQNLINQCGGNPRALFEGVVNARDYLVKEGQEVYDSDIAKARSTILKWCNVTSTIQGHTPMDIVSTWFAQELTEEWRQTMRDAGLLQPVRGEYFREIFFPLMLAEWSSSKKLSSLMSHHIAGCYDSDDQMMTGQGKRVEEILMHYAVVRKLAYHHLKMDSLIGVFFNHSTVSPATKATDRKCKELSTNARLLIKFNETSPNLVRHVSKFTELADGDWNAFRDGHTLYSDLSNEKGIEYITPHFRLINGKSVLTAEVCQIKYTTQSVDWPNWQGKLKTSPRVRVLNKKKIPWFAVYYASHPSIPQTYKTDCIHFPKDALDKFTAPLGTLRLHLGKETPESPLSPTTRSKSKRHLSESIKDKPNPISKPTGRVTKRGKSCVSEENEYDDDTEDTDHSGTSILPTQKLTSSIDKQQQDKITKSLQQSKIRISEKRLRSISTDSEPCLNSANNLAEDKYVKRRQRCNGCGITRLDLTSHQKKCTMYLALESEL